MTNLPQWSQKLATTPRLKRKFVSTNSMARPHQMHVSYVEAEDDKSHFIGTVSKVTRHGYQWEVWSWARKPDDKRRFKIIANGRSRNLLAAIVRVRSEFARRGEADRATPKAA